MAFKRRVPIYQQQSSDNQDAGYVSTSELRGYIKYLAVKQIQSILTANFELDHSRFIAGVKNLSRLIKYYLNKKEKEAISKNYNKYLKICEKIKNSKALNQSEKQSSLANEEYNFYSYLFGALIDAVHSPRFLPEEVHPNFSVTGMAQLKQIQKYINRKSDNTKRSRKIKEEMTKDEDSVSEDTVFDEFNPDVLLKEEDDNEENAGDNEDDGV